ncbi:hypothetical protein CspeluHIS016_0902120 [Cutaneotrichosporon spelunceum]|uniref:Uncharacterized protein n=1 Tax=Cutaneotrichosporon spelunceum TaxID=1672016 RepID=A0AAD3U0J0_9TREE|nr:hypothetical protein CspeluHIS016_0902120 [Cutaneotrichosporon spelunceum]
MPPYPAHPISPAWGDNRKHTPTSLASSRSSLQSVLEESAPEPTCYESTGLLHYPREIILSTGIPASYPELWGTMLFGLRAWPTPILKPAGPFMFAAAVVVAGVWKIQDIGVSTPDALKDPKNPYAASILAKKH